VLSLLAQAARPVLPWGWGFAELAIFVVVVAGIVALVWIGLRAMGVSPPSWVVQALWVVAIVFCICLLIRVIASL
jgi:hypothetical protein